MADGGAIGGARETILTILETYLRPYGWSDAEEEPPPDLLEAFAGAPVFGVSFQHAPFRGFVRAHCRLPAFLGQVLHLRMAEEDAEASRRACVAVWHALLGFAAENIRHSGKVDASEAEGCAKRVIRDGAKAIVDVIAPPEDLRWKGEDSEDKILNLKALMGLEKPDGEREAVICASIGVSRHPCLFTRFRVPLKSEVERVCALESLLERVGGGFESGNVDSMLRGKLPEELLYPASPSHLASLSSCLGLWKPSLSVGGRRAKLLRLLVPRGPPSAATREAFPATWVRSERSCHLWDAMSSTIAACTVGDRLVMSDFAPISTALVHRHPTLSSLAQNPGLVESYVVATTVAVFASLGGFTKASIRIDEARKSTLAAAVFACATDSLESLPPFAPQFTLKLLHSFHALDVDERGLVDLERMCSGSLEIPVTQFALERYLGGFCRPLASGELYKANFEDFCWLDRAAQDGMRNHSISFWFRALDTDGDGYLGELDIMVAYEHRILIDGAVWTEHDHRDDDRIAIYRASSISSSRSISLDESDEPESPESSTLNVSDLNVDPELDAPMRIPPSEDVVTTLFDAVPPSNRHLGISESDIRKSKHGSLIFSLLLRSGQVPKHL